MNLRNGICLAILLALLWTAAHGQSQRSFETSMGGSEMYNSSGLMTEFHLGRVQGWTGLGYSDGFRFGFFSSIPLKHSENRSLRLDLGDQFLSAFLDQDEYDSHRFSVRGASVVTQRGSSRLQVFGGVLTQEAFQPYLHYATSSGGSLTETPIAAVLYSRKLSRTLQLHSINLLSDQFTAVESLGWKPNKTWQFAVAGGKGSGDPYAAVEGHLTHDGWLDLRSSYTLAGANFHRQEGPYSSVEPLGANARLNLSPVDNLRFGMAHEHTLTYMASIPPQPAIQSTFDSGYFAASLKGFRFNSSMTTGKATTAKGNTNTEMVTLTRRITPRWTTFLADINMHMPFGASQAFISINEYRLNPRLSIRQNYTRMNGQNTFSFGGEWRSNRLSFSVDQQMYMSPLAASIGGKGLFQAWTFSVHLRTPHGTNANLDTFVDPMGHMQWGGYLGGLQYSSISVPGDQGLSFPKYVINGKVMDDSGAGVWGVAVVIGKETLLSDSEGNFQVHVKTAKPLPFAVAPESSIQPGRWTLVSAPATVQGGQLDSAPVRVEIKHITRLVAQH